MLYCIIGRTGTGKDYLAKKLEERGLRVLKSYTTRPMRVENEDTHIFITPEEAKDYTDRVAQIKINGYEYFATREQAKNSDVYIIDPVAFDELSANMPETALSIIYLSSDKLDRKCHAVSRAANPIKEEEIFSKRNKDESKMFSDFEKLINNMTKKGYHPHANVIAIKKVENDYMPETMDKLADYIVRNKKFFNRMADITKECCDLNIIQHKNGGVVWTDPNDGHEVIQSYEVAGASMAADQETFTAVMSTYITNSPRFND